MICTNEFLAYLCSPKNLGSLAQLVQSICLTSRGSGVRTPQLPLQTSDIFWGFRFLMQAYFYILFSKSANKYYIGHTTEAIGERLRKHNAIIRDSLANSTTGVFSIPKRSPRKNLLMPESERSKPGKAENESKF